MNTPSAKHGTSSPSVARQQYAPASANAVATEVDVAYIDAKAYPINKNETVLAYAPSYRIEPVPKHCDVPNLEPIIC